MLRDTAKERALIERLETAAGITIDTSRANLDFAHMLNHAPEGIGCVLTFALRIPVDADGKNDGPAFFDVSESAAGPSVLEDGPCFIYVNASYMLAPNAFACALEEIVARAPKIAQARAIHAQSIRDNKGNLSRDRATRQNAARLAMILPSIEVMNGEALTSANTNRLARFLSALASGGGF